MNLVQRTAENFYADLRAHAGGQHVHAVDDGLRPDVRPAELVNVRVEFAHEIVFRFLPEERVLAELNGEGFGFRVPGSGCRVPEGLYRGGILKLHL